MRCRMTQALIHSATCGRHRSARRHNIVNRPAWKYSMLWHSGVNLWVLPAQRWNRPCCTTYIERRALARKDFMDRTLPFMAFRGFIGRGKGAAPIRISLVQGDLAWARVMSRVQGQHVE